MHKCPVRPLLITLSALCAACAPQEVSLPPTTTDTDFLLQGTLRAEALSLSWSPGDQWEQGGCFELTVTNSGPELEFWALDLTFSSEVTSWLYTDTQATWVTASSGAWIGAKEGLLKTGGQVSLSYCSEPAVVPVQISDVELKVSSSAELSPTPSADEQVVAGSLRTETMALLYREDGSSKGGTCLEMTVTNLSSTTLSGWSLKLQLDKKASLTDWWDITPFISGTTLELYPTAGMDKLASMASAIGHVCLSPLAAPVSISVPTSEEEASPTPMPEADGVAGGLASSDLALLYRQDGTSQGGTCLELTITNLSKAAIKSWHVQVLLEKRSSLTDWWTIVPILQDTRLDLYPAAGVASLDPLESAIGHICLSPLTVPVSLALVETERTLAPLSEPHPGGSAAFRLSPPTAPLQDGSEALSWPQQALWNASFFQVTGR